MAQSISDLAVNLSANTGKFQTDMGRAAREAHKATVSMQRSFENVKKTILGLGLGYAVGRAIGAVIKATIDAEKAQAQLAAALRSTAGASGQTMQSLNAHAAALQKLSTFDDDAVASAQALLLQFDRIGGDVFPRATEAVVDFATRMGTDLESAARTVGKALQDPVAGLKALRVVGVSLTESQKEMIQGLIDSGQAAQAQALILGELERHIGGAAEAARDTFGGALKGLQNDVMNLLEGDVSGDGLRGATDAVNDLAKAMQSPSVKDGFGTLTGGMFDVAKAAGSVIGEVVRMAQTVGETFAYLGQTAQHYIDGTKAALSLDLEGAAAARGRMIQEYRNFEQARQDRLNPQAPKAPRKSKAAPAPGLTFPLDGQVTIHGGAKFGMGGGRGGGGGAAADARRAQAEADRMAADAARDYASAVGSLNGVLRDQAEAMGGELVQAAFAYKDTLVQLHEAEATFAKQGKLDAGTQAALAQARDQATAAYRKQADAIQSAKTPLALLLEDMQRELDLLGMTNAQRIAEIELQRLGINLSGQEAAAARGKIEAQAEALEGARKQLEAVDTFRANFAGITQDVLTGQKSIGDGLKSLADMFAQQVARMIAEWATLKLFGEPGSAGGGSMGGWISKLFGLFTGSGSSGGNSFGIPMLGDKVPGFATGTDFAPGGKAWVGENGRELVNLPRGSQVIPNDKIGGMRPVIVNFNGVGSVTKETGQQAAAKVRRAVAMAGRDA